LLQSYLAWFFTSFLNDPFRQFLKVTLCTLKENLLLQKFPFRRREKNRNFLDSAGFFEKRKKFGVFVRTHSKAKKLSSYVWTSLLNYRRPSFYAVFLSAILHICDWKMAFFGTYPLIYCKQWSFYLQIHYMRAYFWSPYLSHITRSTCIIKFQMSISVSCYMQFLCSFYDLTVWVCNFWLKENWRKGCT